METVNHGLGPIHDPRDIIKGPDREQLICSQLEIDIIQLPATMLRDVTLDIKIPIAVPGKPPVPSQPTVSSAFLSRPTKA